MTSKMNRVSGQGHIASESAFSTHVFGNGDEDSTAWWKVCRIEGSGKHYPCCLFGRGQ